MDFKSQICTTREQSERLISLGIKKETADMVWTHAYYSTWAATAKENPLYVGETDEDTIPAWSLHRLIQMRNDILDVPNRTTFYKRQNPYEALIKEIEWLVEMEYFNFDYLDEKVWKG